MTQRREPARRAVIQKLASLNSAGVTNVPRRKTVKKSAEPAKAKPQTQPPTTQAPEAPKATKPVKDSLPIIQAEVAACTRCDILASGRTQTVFGVGNPKAQICFVGEAPGADEDAQGEPFVGRAGQLLTKIIEACHLKREDVYILNVLKCRPPNNRNPLPNEVANCRGFLDRQLALIQPQVICCLGTIAAQTLLETDTPIGRLRGKFHTYRNIPVLCTYHPAYLLRNPPAKRFTWDDMKLLFSHLGVEL